MTQTDTKHKKIRFDPKDTGMPLIEIVGRRFSPYDDVYHFIITRTWRGFFGLVAATFVAVNTVFACLYLAQPGAIDHVDSFEAAFFFSVQTLGTIGYGAMAPVTRYGHLVVSAEALVGLLFTAMVTGLTFAKFARPTARILFSRRPVIAKRNGVPHLMIRLANWRHNLVAEAQARVILMTMERTTEGETMRRATDLRLVRDTTALFVLTWTVMHEIDASSPLHGPGAMDALKAKDAEIFLSLSGVDETLAANIHGRHRYRLEDVAVGARFADVVTTLPDGRRQLDYSAFHDIIPETE